MAAMSSLMPLSAAPRTYLPRQRGNGLKLMHCQCRAGVHDHAHDEEHQAFSITLVDRGHAPEPLPRQDERARTAAHYIEMRGTEALTLDQVAAAAGLSPFHLMRVFRRAIGVTPHQYLMR